MSGWLRSPASRPVSANRHPAVSVPAAAAGLYIIATRMCAGIAYLRGYDVGTDEVRSAILVSLLGSAGASTLKKAGVEIGRRSTAVALERLPARILVEINKRVGYLLVVKAGEKGVLNLSKLVPLVGGPIGAAIDGVSCKTIATYALRTFDPQATRKTAAPGDEPAVDGVGTPELGPAG
jgi:hypothetical protein